MFSNGRQLKRPTSSVIEALISQCFRISANKQSISLSLALNGTRLIIQLSHGADYSASEGRGLIGGIGTHLCCLDKGSAKHERKVNKQVTRRSK